MENNVFQYGTLENLFLVLYVNWEKGEEYSEFVFRSVEDKTAFLPSADLFLGNLISPD